MKDQKIKKIKQKPARKLVISGLLFLTIVSTLVVPSILYPREAKALGIPTIDIAHIGETILEGIAAAGRFALEQFVDLTWRLEDSAAAVAYKSALHLLLNNFAYDAATWLASGGKGQTPYFHTDSWGDYLGKAVDGAAGEFISELGKSWYNFDVCNPDLPFRINIVQGFQDNFRRRRPDCTASELARDWERFVSSENFIDNFVQRFRSDQNEILIGIELYDKYYQALSFELVTNQLDRQEGQGFKPVESLISGKIVTPAWFSSAEAQQLLEKGHFAAEQVYTGDIIADAINTFIETLAGKLFDRLFREGLASLRGTDRSSSRGFVDTDLYTGESGRDLFSGRQAAEARYVTLVDAGIITSGPYEILRQLSNCPDQDNPAPDNCVIDQDFRLAIEQEMTVREAINSDYLDGNAAFGFTSQGFEPPYNEGYPYRSLLILRSHRIIPVTWELAAEIINRGFTSNDRLITLNTLIADYNNDQSPFYHLIDENWVLKAPESYCAAEGFGPIVVTDRISNDGQRIITRDTYCADYQSCIEKDSEGNCIYGYCTEERPIWNLQADSCLAEYSSCQTFVDRAGEAVSYLQNTLNYNGCSIDNVGCQWYCQDYNVVNGVWTCINDTEKVLKPCVNPEGCNLSASCNIAEGEDFCVDSGSGANINISSACGPNSQWWNDNLFGPGIGGCSVTAGCTVAFQGVQCIETGCEDTANQLPNSSFETGGAPGELASGWQGDLTYFERVSGGSERIHSGRNSIRFYNAGGVVGGSPISGANFASNEINLPRFGTYTISGYIFDQLNVGTISVSAAVEAGGAAFATAPVTITESAKNRWYQVSFDLDVDFGYCSLNETQSCSATTPCGSGNGVCLTGLVKIIVRVNGEQVSGTAWFDDFKISESCLIQPVTLSLAGAVDKDQSKLHLDRDAQQCNVDSAGCSEFYSSPTKKITNLLFQSGDPSFELYQDSPTEPGDQDFVNWLAFNGVTNDPRTIVEASSDSRSGATAMKITEGVGEVYVRHLVDVGGSIKNRKFIISYYAKVLNAPDFSCVSEPDFIYPDPPLGCHIFGLANFVRSGGSSTALGKISSVGINQNWQRFSSLIQVPNDSVFDAQSSLEIVLRGIPSAGASGYIIYDDIQLEEVTGTNQTEPSIFQGYNTLDNISLRKPPGYLGCQGFTLDRPSDYVLNGVLETQCVGDTLVWRPDSCTNILGTDYCCHELDPPECLSYARYCQEDEIGCQAYTPVSGGPMIPAIVATDDYCPQECIGYDTFKQSPTYFESLETLEFFIPQTAQQCSAAVAGCDEFTNLDEVAAGGEGKEHYLYLRQCKKPDPPTCDSFYSWQGSDETGFQLTIYDLQNEIGVGPDYAITDTDQWLDQWCNDKTPGVGGQPACCDAADDLLSNPFCREFFDSGGGAHYRIFANTISCTDDCHPFRKTRLGESDPDAQTNCDLTNGEWNSTNLTCVYNAVPSQTIACPASAAGCREYRGNAGGNIFTAFYDDFEDGDIKDWMYGEISSEALTVGGHSIKTANTTYPSFNHAAITTRINLGANCESTLTHCTAPGQVNCYDETLDKCVASNGTETCLVDRGDYTCSVLSEHLRLNGTYLISFWAKSDGGNLGLGLGIATNTTRNDLGTFNVAPEWNYYTYGPFVASEFDSGTALFFNVASPDRDVFLDNITIKEVIDYAYVIKNSWQTPNSCDTNPFVSPPQPAPQFMLGCQQYRDVGGQVHNLKSFNSLCRESAVGCEALIDTFNSTDQFAQEFNIADEVGYIQVPQDEIAYLTNRAEFSCDPSQKGCQRLGLPNINQTGAVTNYTDAYLINNPDQYQSILCGSDEVGCEEYQTNRGFSYFKDPGLQTCEYRQVPDQPNFGWFKISSNSLTPDCPIVRSPLGSFHPTDNWVGICPAEVSGCTELIDPISDIVKNIIFNADFTQNVDGSGPPDGWNPLGFSVRLPITDWLAQKINLKRNSLYTVSIISKDTGAATPPLNTAGLHLEIVDCPGITSFDHSMVGTCIASSDGAKIHAACSSNVDCDQQFGPGGDGVCALDILQIPPTDYVNDWTRRPDLPSQRQYSGRFFVPADIPSSCALLLVDKTGGRTIKDDLIESVAVKESGVYYALAGDLNKTSCNGVVNNVDGCVLFNDRSAINYKIGETDNSYLRFDADVSKSGVNDSVPVAQCGGVCDSNTILKVRPDRTCGQWLDCQTKVKAVGVDGKETDYCIELAACSDMNEKGECLNYLLPERQQFNSDNSNTTVDFIDNVRLSNLSGYAKAGATFAAILGGSNFADSNTIRGLYPYNLMEQFGEVANVANGNFEDYPELEYPVGWAWANGEGRKWGSHLFRVISNSVEAQDSDGISLQGKTSLKVNANNEVISDPISVLPRTSYTLSASINTLNLQPEDAQATVEVVVNSGVESNPLISLTPPAKIVVNSRLDWTNRAVIIEPSAIASATEVRIRVRNEHANPDLIAQASYFDNIQMLPTLEVQDLLPFGTNPKYYIGRSCRVYPQQDSLACNYRDDQGALQRGWSGYCLETDPSNPGVCLQWWPVDLIKGDSFGTYIGYNDRLPLYYCLETNADIVPVDFIEEGELLINGSFPRSEPQEDSGSLDNDKCITFRIANNSTLNFPDGSSITLSALQRCSGPKGWAVGVCKYDGEKTAGIDIFHQNLIENFRVFDLGGGRRAPLGDCFTGFTGTNAFTLTETSPGNVAGYTTTGNPTWLAANKGSGKNYCSLGTKAIFDDEGFLDQMWFWIIDSSSVCGDDHRWEVGVDVTLRRNYCTLLAQTVTSVGENKAWVSRVAEGSSYSRLECTIDGELPIIFTEKICAPGVDCLFVPGENTFRCDTDGDGVGNGDRCSVCEYPTDYAPFGAAVPEDPYSIVNSEKLYWQLPDTEAFEAPYQARMGQVPYARAEPFVEPVVPTNVYLKRLFAQSFSFWRWQSEGELFCIGGDNDGRPCTNANQQCPEGQCEDHGNICQGSTDTPGASCVPANNPCASGFTCTTFDINCQNYCNYDPEYPDCDYKNPSGTCKPCSSSNDCDPTNTDPEYRLGLSCDNICETENRCVDGNLLTPDPVGCCPGSSPSCNQIVTCSPDSLNAGSGCSLSTVDECPDGICTTQRRGFQPDLTGDYTWKPPEDLCQFGTFNTRVFLCSNDTTGTSPGPGDVCNPVVPNTCVGGRCDEIDLNPLTEYDYCAVAPKIRNILINNKDGQDGNPVNVTNQRGSGQVTLFFNALVDANQLPLTAYQVDWGEGSKVAVSGTNLRDQSNPDVPYKLTHSYSYYEVLSKNQSGPADRIFCASAGESGRCSLSGSTCNGSGPALCGNGAGGVCISNLPANTCAVVPRIQVYDNWGWCNGNINVYTSLPRTPNQWGYQVAAVSNNCNTDNAWTYYPGYVIVGVSD